MRTNLVIFFIINMPHCRWALASSFNDRIDDSFLDIVSVFLIFWLSLSDSITLFFLNFLHCFPVPESKFKLIQIKPNPNELWLVEWYRGVSFHMGNSEKYKGPISHYWRGYPNILLFFSDCINIFQRLLVFSSSTDQVLAVGLLELCSFRWENLEPWNYSRMNFPFPNIVAVILIFWYFFSDSMNIFQRLLVFSSSGYQILVVWLVFGCVTLCWQCFGILE